MDGRDFSRRTRRIFAGFVSISRCKIFAFHSRSRGIYCGDSVPPRLYFISISGRDDNNSEAGIIETTKCDDKFEIARFSTIQFFHE